MRLKRRADHLRACGWVNFFLTLILCVVGSPEGVALYLVGAIWAGFVMVLTYGAAMLIDKHAERVVRR